jgi:hypothetical protein
VSPKKSHLSLATLFALLARLTDGRQLAHPDVRAALHGARLRGAVPVQRLVTALARVEKVQPARAEQTVADRALVIAEIPTENVFGTPPSDAAAEWGGVLLRREERSFTVLLAPEPWDLPAVIREL